MKSLNDLAATLLRRAADKAGSDPVVAKLLAEHAATLLGASTTILLHGDAATLAQLRDDAASAVANLT